jgi:hypothetical protein
MALLVISLTIPFELLLLSIPKSFLLGSLNMIEIMFFVPMKKRKLHMLSSELAEWRSGSVLGS